MSGRWLLLAGLSAALFAISNAALAQFDAKTTLFARCASCHERTAEGGLSRISEQRKTPEGWDMTIVRMMLVHGVEITPEERRVLVKYLADTQGLAPQEAAPFRYILEREPAVFEDLPDEELGIMCARCHSWARVGLQRRTESEWLKLSHFHLGQWPTIEYQALARDRNWWEIASEQVPPKLAELFPLKSAAWDAWKNLPSPNLSGEWRFVGHEPGRGDFQGVATLERAATDNYAVQVSYTYDDGQNVRGTGEGTVYTGYEWRSRIRAGGDNTLQVFAVSRYGRRMEGRSFLEDADSIGSRVTAVRMDGVNEILAVMPAYLRAGESGEIAIHGVGLAGDVDLGEGLTVDEVVSADAMSVVVRVTAAADAPVGPHTVSVGDVSADGLFTVYQQIDYVTVEPGYNIARVGGGGGPLPPVPAVFDAVAWLNGADGEQGTDDDVRIGVVPASWAVDNFDDIAAEMQDAEYAGTMQPTGVFLPAEAGPNQKRPFSTNNAGNLKVIATVKDGDREVQGEGQLLVTVQRWNDPPIR